LQRQFGLKTADIRSFVAAIYCAEDVIDDMDASTGRAQLASVKRRKLRYSSARGDESRIVCPFFSPNSSGCPLELHSLATVRDFCSGLTFQFFC
jgi:hypothetical protein